LAQAFAHLDIQAPVHKILQEHRAGHYDLEKAVYLLKRYTLRQSEAAQRDIFDTLWSVLSTEPLSPSSQKGAYILCVQAVIIRSVAEFGPTPELPARVFGLLKWDAPPECMAFWAQLVCSQLSYSMFHNAQRFSQATLDNAKDLCGTYTSGQSNTLNQRTFPEPVVFSVRGLEEAIQSIEAARFADHIETEHDPQEDTAMTGDRSGGSPTPKEVRRRIFIGHGG
jgi:hypothetical protein